MMDLLQELAVLRNTDRKTRNNLVSKKRRREIREEMKQLASSKKKAESESQWASKTDME